MTDLSARVDFETSPWPSTNPQLASSPSVRRRYPLRVLPAIREIDGDILCNGIVISLQKKPLTARLFKAFLNNQGRSLHTDELLAIVYEELLSGERSVRYRASLRQNLVKMISRARQTADEAVNERGMRWIEWFCYDPDGERWSLYRLTNEYLSARELAFNRQNRLDLH